MRLKRSLKCESLGKGEGARFLMRLIFLAGLAAPAAAQDISTATAALPGLPGVSSTTLTAASTSTATAASGESPVPPRPWVVGAIEISGQKNVSASAIRSQVKARKGDLYDRPDLDRDVQSILSLGQFERVGADISLTDQPVPEHLRKVAGSPFLVKATFIIKEKPLVHRIIFEGNKKVSKGVLRDAITLKEKDPLDAIKVHDDEGKIIEKYRDKGFLDATVGSAIHLDTNTLQSDVTFKIDEGIKSRIELVTIDGVLAFKEKKILKLMEKNRRKKVYVEKDLKTDLKKIETFYLNNGFLDVEVGTATVITSDDKTKIYIRFAVNEGRSYKFGDSTFSGNEIYTSTELVKAIEYRKGKTFNQEHYEETIRGVQEMYAEKGRLKARVTPTKTYNKGSGLMDVHYAISEGGIVYIDHIDLEGNKNTKTYVLRRELTVKPGEVFSASKIRRSREKILNLGFIDDVDVDIQGTNDPDKVDVTFDVGEGKPGLLTAGAAYSSTDGLIGTLSMSHLNLFGRAQQAKVEWQFGKRVQDYSLSWKTPWIYDHPTSLGTDIFNTRRISPFQTSASAYVNQQRGATLSIGPRFQNDKYQLNFSYTFSRITISNVDPQFLGPLQPGTSSLSTLSAGFSRDTRDNIWDPSRGSRHALSLQLAGGPLLGNLNFLQYSLTDIAYFKLFDIAEYPFVLMFANRAGYVTQFGATTEVPVTNRFFLGGQDTMRGYTNTGQVGFPSGGKIMDVFNIEFGFPLAREKRKTIVKIVAFFDMGTAWDRVRDLSARVGSGVRDIKTDAGLGIRFTTPAFPIRLDWGYGFNHPANERRYQINFGLGNLF